MTAQLELDAALVDVPNVAGPCDPVLLVDAPLRGWITDASHIFPGPPTGLERFPGFYAGGRDQYVKLTARQLRAGLLVLRDACLGGGAVFPVGKSNGVSQR